MKKEYVKCGSTWVCCGVFLCVHEVFCGRFDTSNSRHLAVFWCLLFWWLPVITQTWLRTFQLIEKKQQQTLFSGFHSYSEQIVSLMGDLFLLISVFWTFMQLFPSWRWNIIENQAIQLAYMWISSAKSPLHRKSVHLFLFVWRVTNSFYL